MKNRIVHFEIHAGNIARAKKFYGDVFGWEFEDANVAVPYWLVMTDSKDSTQPGINGGLLERNVPAPAEGLGPNAFVCTVQVENYDEIHEKIIKAGGTIALPKMAMPAMAWIGYYKDVEGNTFGVFQADPNAR